MYRVSTRNGDGATPAPLTHVDAHGASWRG
jgi:hypothetical protein